MSRITAELSKHIAGFSTYFVPKGSQMFYFSFVRVCIVGQQHFFLLKPLRRNQRINI